MTLTLGKKMQGGVECLYELNLLQHVGVVAKRVCAGPLGVEMAVVTPIIMEQPSYPLGELDTFL